MYEGVVELRGAEADPSEEALLVREGFGARGGHEAFELVVLDREDPWDAWESGALSPDLSDSVPAAPDLGAERSHDAGEQAQDVDRDLFEGGDDLFEAEDDPFQGGDDPFEGNGQEDAFEQDEFEDDGPGNKGKGHAYGNDK